VTRWKLKNRQEGITLVEVLISLGIFAVLLGSMFTIASETSNYVHAANSEFTVQREASSAFQKLKEVLRKSSWITTDPDFGITYPRILEDGTLEFLILEDLDGNGYAFNQATGLLEWNDTVFSVRHNADDKTLSVYRGNLPVRHLGSNIQNVQFTTFLQDSSLNYKEIRVSILAEKTTNRGRVIRFQFSGSIYMRN